MVKLKMLKVYASIQCPEINLPWAHSDLKYLYVAAFVCNSGKINVTLYPGLAVVYSGLMRLIMNWLSSGQQLHELLKYCNWFIGTGFN